MLMVKGNDFDQVTDSNDTRFFFLRQSYTCLVTLFTCQHFVELWAVSFESRVILTFTKLQM